MSQENVEEENLRVVLEGFARFNADQGDLEWRLRTLPDQHHAGGYDGHHHDANHDRAHRLVAGTDEFLHAGQGVRQLVFFQMLPFIASHCCFLALVSCVSWRPRTDLNRRPRA